jgi:DnaJ-class molecular chaperone
MYVNSPDKNPDNREEAGERFKKIGEAYSVLADEQKRAEYDRPSSHGFSHPHFEHFDMSSAEDLFNHFFQDMGMGGGFFGGSPFGRAQASSRPQMQSGFGSGGFGFGDMGGFGMMGMPGFGQMGMGGFSSFGGFGDMGGNMQSSFSSFSSSSSSGGGNGVRSRSTSTSTTIVNGQRVTQTVTRTVHADGRVEETVSNGGNAISGSDFGSHGGLLNDW